MDVPLHIQLRLLAKCAHYEFYTSVGAPETQRYCLYCAISRFRVGETPLDIVRQHHIIFHTTGQDARCSYCNTPVKVTRPVTYCLLCTLTLPEYLSLLTDEQRAALHENIRTKNVEIRIEQTREPAGFEPEIVSSSELE